MCFGIPVILGASEITEVMIGCSVWLYWLVKNASRLLVCTYLGSGHLEDQEGNGKITLSWILGLLVVRL